MVVLQVLIIGCQKSEKGEALDLQPQAQYNDIIENQFIETATNNISTFSVDVDGASYSNCRQLLYLNAIPFPNMIRTEEFINYFQYDYAEPQNGLPFGYDAEMAQCPWDTAHRLLRIGFKGHTLGDERKGTNFVLLVDVSGSMDDYLKLGLFKSCMIKFVKEKLDYRDRVSIVTYSGKVTTLLKPTPGSNKDLIIKKIKKLSAEGSTNGGDAIKRAYKLAQDNFIEGGNNRIIMGTDGDFNVGISSQEELVELIEEKRKSGVFLTVLGFGRSNLQEGTVEQIANHGNGNYEFIDNLQQGEKVFINEFNSFYAVAKDVKVQVEFDTGVVKSYRLIGYENRVLSNDEFDVDSVDAGEIGADQDVTALYELILHDSIADNQKALNVAVRYKLPNENISNAFDFDVHDTNKKFSEASENTRFAASVAAFALVLRNSQNMPQISYDEIKYWATGASSYNPYNYKTDFVNLIEKAKSLQ